MAFVSGGGSGMPPAGGLSGQGGGGGGGGSGGSNLAGAGGALQNGLAGLAAAGSLGGLGAGASNLALQNAAAALAAQQYASGAGAGNYGANTGQGNQLLELLLQQQLQQQQQQQQQQATAGPANQLVNQLLASALLGGLPGGLGALQGAPSPLGGGGGPAGAAGAASGAAAVAAAAAAANQQNSQAALLQQLQTQMALQQLLPQLQNSGSAAGGLLSNPLLSNPLMLYQQMVQQQQQTLLQQMLQQQQQAAQTAAAQQGQAQQTVAQPQVHHPMPTVAAPSAQHTPQAHAFHPPSHSAASSGSVEAQLREQERLMQYMSEQQQQQQQQQQHHQAASTPSAAIGIARREPVEASVSAHPTAIQPGVSGLSAGQMERAARMAAAQAQSAQQQQVPTSGDPADRIQRLIDENEMIVQPQQVLLKRRPYHRQVGGQSSIEESNSGGSGSSRTSPGLRDHRMLNQRSQSLFEMNGARNFGSLTTGQPFVRQHPVPHNPVCSYCELAFPNEAGLQAHEARCSKRLEVEKEKALRAETSTAPLVAPVAQAPPAAPPAAPEMEMSRHPLKRRLLAAYAAEQENPAKQSKQECEVVVVDDSPIADMQESAADLLRPELPRRATVGAFQLETPVTIPPSTSQIIHAARQQVAQLANLQLLQAEVSAAQAAQAAQVAQAAQAVQAAQAAQAAQAVQVAQAAAAHAQAQSTAAAPPPTAPLQLQSPNSAFVSQASASAATPKRETNPFSSDFFVLDGRLDKPYTLTLTEAQKGGQSDPLSVRRSRGRNITSETYVCLHRPQPMFVEQAGNISMYSNWQTLNINEAESKLNLAYMGMCSSRPRTGCKAFWRYTTANREHGQFRMTHSSFWEISVKQRYRQAQLEAEEQQAVDARVKVETLVSENEDMVTPMKNSNTVKSETASTSSFMEVEVKPSQSGDHQHSLRPQSQTPPQVMREVVVVAEERENSDDFSLDTKPAKPPRGDPVIGGYRTDEVYVYVRGRGRGRYVCERCGIRCKKPSMLKKHIKSHTDVRPYKCKECNFSFKTKGNLTKHLGSKTHRRRIQTGGADYDSDDEDRLEIATPDDENPIENEKHPFDEMECSSDEEDEHMPPIADHMYNRAYGQENILVERSAHTPPTCWMFIEDDSNRTWPSASTERNCSSAPPSNMMYPTTTSTKTEAAKKRLDLASTEPQARYNTAAASTSETSTTPVVVTVVPAGFSSSPLPQVFGVQPAVAPAFLQPTASHPQAHASNGHAQAYATYLASQDLHKCDQCDRTFRKAHELALHYHVHNVGKETKNRMFQCPECRIPQKTKQQLAKHAEQAHGLHLAIDDNMTASVDPCASTQSVLGGANVSAANPRSFVCTDCNIGFRKHGILAKHLRSKTHVTKLETTHKVPLDTLSLLTKKDNCASLNEIDTTNCEKATQSIIAMVEKIRAEYGSLPGTAVGTPTHSVGLNLVGLECREQLAESPRPTTYIKVADSPNGHRPQSGTSSPYRSRCGSATSSTVDSVVRKKSDIGINHLGFRDTSYLSALGPLPIGIANAATAAATLAASGAQFQTPKQLISSTNVWMPPRIDERAMPVRLPPPPAVAAEKEDEERDSPLGKPVANGLIQATFANFGTKCPWCNDEKESPVELQIHLYDHFPMRDGSYLKCPRPACDKLYPNMNSLRVHLHAHYQRLAQSTPDVREDDSVSSATSVVVGMRGVEEQRTSPLSEVSDSSACHSPNGMVRAASAEVKLRGGVDGVVETNKLPCTLCSMSFSNAADLQRHWFVHVPSRSHICQVCDAGFTTQDALAAHAATHATRINGVA